MDQAVADYIESVPAQHRALFDRVHRLILDAYPDAVVSMSYGMPTYTRDKRRLHVGSWRHGVSIYGWKAHGDGGFTERHPELRTSGGTIRLRPEDAASLADGEILGLARSALVD
jgi:uncharacterized protein YdhG (YjbR/CyaY superfamily)